MNDRAIVRAYVGALKRFTKEGTTYDVELLRECIILAIGAYLRLYKADIDKIVFDEADPRQRVLEKVMRDLYHEGFVVRKKDKKLYYYLTTKGGRHYSKYLGVIKSEIYDQPTGHTNF